MHTNECIRTATVRMTINVGSWSAMIPMRENTWSRTAVPCIFTNVYGCEVRMRTNVSVRTAVLASWLWSSPPGTRCALHFTDVYGCTVRMRTNVPGRTAASRRWWSPPGTRCPSPQCRSRTSRRPTWTAQPGSPPQCWATQCSFNILFSSKKQPPVSTTPAENFAISSAGVVDTSGKFATGVYYTGGKFVTGGKQWEQHQTADNLKSTWRKKIYRYANSTTKSCPKEIRKTFLILRFFHLPPVSKTPVMHLELQYLRKFSKNFKWP